MQASAQRFFWFAAIAAAVACGVAAQCMSVAQIGTPAPRPPLPVPGVTYVSATYDGQTDHSLFYFNLFGFGDRIRSARTLVIGSSHAEFGIYAEQFGPTAFNMALGGGEGLTFATALLRKYRPRPSLVVVDSYGPDEGLSTEGARTLSSTPTSSLQYVLNVWSGFLRDWLLQGLLPRLTIGPHALSWEPPLRSAVIRNWYSADVTMFYSGRLGEVFADPTKATPIQPIHMRPSIPPSPDDLAAILEVAAETVVTTVPYPEFDLALGRKMAEDLRGRFVEIAPGELRFFDFHHVNASSRAIVTKELLKPQP